MAFSRGGSIVTVKTGLVCQIFYVENVVSKVKKIFFSVVANTTETTNNEVERSGLKHKSNLEGQGYERRL